MIHRSKKQVGELKECGCDGEYHGQGRAQAIDLLFLLHFLSLLTAGSTLDIDMGT